MTEPILDKDNCANIKISSTNSKSYFRRPTLKSLNTPTKATDDAIKSAFTSAISNIIMANEKDFLHLGPKINSIQGMGNDASSHPTQKTLFTNSIDIADWNPIVILPESHNFNKVCLNTLEIFAIDPALDFCLENSYTVTKILPRSTFGILCQSNITHSFVFSLKDSEDDSSFFQDLGGMRQSVAVNIKELNSKERWELHLKPSKGVIFGYLCQVNEIEKIVSDQVESLKRGRKIPLVLDLDDTLVRMVGNHSARYVPESQITKVTHRVRELSDGRSIVLASRVHEFIAWASNFFDISICSLGEQPYVDMVTNILNSEKHVIRGGASYSARGEYLHILQSKNPCTPPKDLSSLFAFYPIIHPIIIDDSARMWPVDQQDSIIIVRDSQESVVWDVALFPQVQRALSYIHENYFKALDSYDSGHTKIVPSTLTYYKEHLRLELARNISES